MMSPEMMGGRWFGKGEWTYWLKPKAQAPSGKGRRLAEWPSFANIFVILPPTAQKLSVAFDGAGRKRNNIAPLRGEGCWLHIGGWMAKTLFAMEWAFRRRGDV